MTYLKIKDNVDLKELERLGFKYTEYKYGNWYDFYYDKYNSIDVSTKNRQIVLWSGDGEDKCLCKLFDLIQAGLVEKSGGRVMKIKDLTEEQINKICNKQKTCIGCPLYIATHKDQYECDVVVCPRNFQLSIQDLDKEVEV